MREMDSAARLSTPYAAQPRNDGNGSDRDCCEDAPSWRGALVFLSRLIRDRHRAVLNAHNTAS